MKNKIFLLLVLSIFLISGCGKEKREEDKTSDKVDSDEAVIICTRKADAGNNVTASLTYKVYYEGDYVTMLNSIEEVTSSDEEALDEYEEAYKNVFSVYDGLEYYENTITRKGDTVISETNINYEKIDTNKLLEIEGEEDNVIKDGKVKVEDWISFAEKYGADCES